MATSVVHYLKDYQPLDFEVESIDLTFELSPQNAEVHNRMIIRPRPGFSGRLMLNGEHTKLLCVKLNGLTLDASDYELNEEQLILSTPSQDFELEILTEINPESNTRLEGLYRSGGNYCTQCEAEGFRCITYFPDRPDVLTRFTTKIIADKSENQVLLSNGNLIEKGELPSGKHYAVWHDPFPKPCYLFALVAGNLSCLQDRYQTADGREITLQIYTDERHLSKCHHAMASLKHSMRWDEERFGLVYDLDIYMIVAVDDFNMGAMENKGLNIFNSKYVLADSDSATDIDFEGVEAVIAHEYFHNWTGNRVTCRDWFQLTLKEGLTVFRDQEFTADQLSPSVKRIEDVRRLRSMQFAEDDGPMAHPIQPQSYVEMNNFYTLTVYEKGAEVVRLYQTLLGKDGFRKGMDLYFKRHDGQAVTVEDFRDAMADANHVDLSQMQAWYLQAGTPKLKIEIEYHSASRELVMACEQSIPGSERFDPLMIPIKVGFYNQQGQPIVLTPEQIKPAAVRCEGNSATLVMSQAKQQFVIRDIDEPFAPSLLQEFSAPVKLIFDYTDAQLLHLARYDLDSFNRWEAIQRIALKDLQRNVSNLQQGLDFGLSQAYITVFGQLLDEAKRLDGDLALLAYALNLPDVDYLMDQYEKIDIDAIHQAHKSMTKALGETFYTELQTVYQLLNQREQYEYSQKAIARRLLKNQCLSYLLASEREGVAQLAEHQYTMQSDMTDVYAALLGLSQMDSPQTDQSMNHFYQKWRDEPLVLDKWFALQAASERGDVFARLEWLLTRPEFSYKNPNRARSVIGAFARRNLLGFHHKSGKGYVWLADQVLTLDAINPQVAARMLVPLTQWKKMNKERQAKMRSELQRIKQHTQSKDVDEIVSKALDSKS
jgi:aminopeptidase N